MNTDQLIQELKMSKLIAECPEGEEFPIAKTILFDGTKPFPKEALELKKQLLELLNLKQEDFIKRKKLTTEKAQITTRSVNIGKNIEKILPTMQGFPCDLPDCRFLNDPIDLLVFEGLSRNKIESISFVEAKTGGAKLNTHQKMVKDAVEDKKVFYEGFK